MFVCSCLTVTDTEVRACVARGARSLDDLARECEAGTGCGGCVEHLESLLEQAPATRPCHRQPHPARG